MPGITIIGTLYCPKGTLDKWNSGDNHLGALLKKRGWTIQEMPNEETVENSLEENGNEE